MKATNLSPKVLIGDPKLVLDLDRGLMAARRKQFLREYRKLYKETKRFVDEVLRQNSHKLVLGLDRGATKGFGERKRNGPNKSA